MPDYQEIYLRNNYEVELPDGSLFTFSLIDFHDNIFFDRPFAIITAHNPNNELHSKMVNERYDKKLYSELYSNYTILRAEGCYEGHCEKGYLVNDIGFTEAVNIGTKHGQYAIFYNDTNELKYVECKDGSVIVSIRRRGSEEPVD